VSLQDEAEQVKARLAGWLRPEVWSSTRADTHRHLDEGSTFWLHRASPVGQAADQTEQGGLRRIRERLRTEMLALRGANAEAGAATTQPDYSRLVGLLPGGGVERGVQRARQLPVDAHLQVGKQAHPNKSKRWVVTATSACSTSPGGPVGVRRPHQRRLPHQVRLDWHRPTPPGQGRIVSDDPALAQYWATVGAEALHRP